MPGDDDVALCVIEPIAEIEFDRRWRGLIEHLLQLRLVMLFENLDRADVSAENANVPFLRIEIGNRNAGVVLHNRFAVIENEIADATEAVLEHQIR